jgi:thiamine-phosphate pyrophosphorylase
MPGKSPVDFTLYLITDRHQVEGGDLCAAVEGALRGGVRAVQLREKDLSSAELYDLACRLRQCTDHFGAKLFINDRLDIAQAVGADGVHLGERSLPVTRVRALAGDHMLLGVSCHSRESALAAAAGGADFITFSPVYFTPSKAMYGEPQGIDRLAEVCRLSRLPVFALGGISRDRVGDVRACGAHGVSLISAILAAADPERAAREMLVLLA